MNDVLLNVLLVEDNPGDVYIIKDSLKYAETKFVVSHAAKLSDAITISENWNFDVVMLDLGLPDSFGLETLKTFLSSNVKAPVVVMTGLDDEEMALASMKEGAQDYLVKNNLNPEYIVRSIRYAIERKKIQEFQKKNTRQFSILSAATIEINECEDIQSIYHVICEKINILLHQSIIIPVNFYDKDTIYEACNDTNNIFKSWLQKLNFSADSKVIQLEDIYKKQLNLNFDGKLYDVTGNFPNLF